MGEDKKLPGFCPLELTEAMKAMLAEYKMEWSRNRQAHLQGTGDAADRRGRAFVR